jgi:trehalose 6-phosphate phosphatase
VRAATAPPPAQLSADGWALFLDLDGTLIEQASEPDAVVVDAQLPALLQQLAERTGGATALISGRAIARLDALLHPAHLPAAGLHGFEHRDARGIHSRGPLPPPQTLAAARDALAALAASDARLLFEDKGFAFALHFRKAPQLESQVLAAVGSVAAASDGEFELRRGFRVAELAPYGVSKATAVDQFMAAHPFRGRLPLFVGDDLTDEPAFEWVNRAGGLSVAVNVRRPTAARARLGSVADVRVWLHRLFGDPGAPS